MQIFNGKNKDMTKEAIVKAYWLVCVLQTRPIELLEDVDFSRN
jgi:hypothetical protein